MDRRFNFYTSFYILTRNNYNIKEQETQPACDSGYTTSPRYIKSGKNRGGGFFPRLRVFVRKVLMIHSPPALFFKAEISSRTLILPLFFRPGSVHSG